MTRPEKIIHQTWKESTIPDQYASFVASVKQHNRGYEYRLWTDQNNRELIAKRFPWFLPTYDSYKHPIERADAVRYFILYEYGGVYIDLDMECLKSVDDLFEKAEVWFSIEAGPSIYNKVISNAFMATPRKHPLFKDLIRQLPRVIHRDITFQDVFNNTGPNMLHQFLMASFGQYAIKIISLEDICPIGVVQQLDDHVGLEIDQIKAKGNLTILHHNTESWNVQHPCPDSKIDGYTLFKQQDIFGYDIDYVTGDVRDMITACNDNKEAIGFNYNGYLKGAGGILSPMSANSSWLKPGCSAWVCIKNCYLEQVL